MQQQSEAEQARAGKAMETAASDGNVENRNKEGEYFPDRFSTFPQPLGKLSIPLRSIPSFPQFPQLRRLGIHLQEEKPVRTAVALD
jgi:hypothetical protein